MAGKKEHVMRNMALNRIYGSCASCPLGNGADGPRRGNLLTPSARHRPERALASLDAITRVFGRDRHHPFLLDKVERKFYTKERWQQKCRENTGQHHLLGTSPKVLDNEAPGLETRQPRKPSVYF